MKKIWVETIKIRRKMVYETKLNLKIDSKLIRCEIESKSIHFEILSKIHLIN